jgi:hypothetical protein
LYTIYNASPCKNKERDCGKEKISSVNTKSLSYNFIFLLHKQQAEMLGKAQVNECYSTDVLEETITKVNVAYCLK